MEKKDPIDKAKRYLQKAKDILKEKAGIDGDYYTYSKSVRMAGDTAWKGCLVALEAVFEVKKTAPKNKRVSIDDYKDEVAKIDEKLLTIVIESYNTLHLYMGCDGTKVYKTCAGGMEMAEYIIKWCENEVMKSIKTKYK